MCLPQEILSFKKNSGIFVEPLKALLSLAVRYRKFIYSCIVFAKNPGLYWKMFHDTKQKLFCTQHGPPESSLSFCCDTAISIAVPSNKMSRFLGREVLGELECERFTRSDAEPRESICDGSTSQFKPSRGKRSVAPFTYTKWVGGGDSITQFCEMVPVSFGKREHDTTITPSPYATVCGDKPSPVEGLLSAGGEKGVIDPTSTVLFSQIHTQPKPLGLSFYAIPRVTWQGVDYGGFIRYPINSVQFVDFLVGPYHSFDTTTLRGI